MTPATITTEEHIALVREIEKLRGLIHTLSHNPAYGCLNRAGLELQWQPKPGTAIIFGDIDDMHRMNTEYGYDGVNDLIRAALKDLQTRHDTMLACSWFSGDEFVFVLPADDAVPFACRVLSVFQVHGLSITLGTAPLGLSLAESVAEASRVVQVAKQTPHGRGKVYREGSIV